MIVDRSTLRPIVNIDGQTCFGCGAHNPVGLHMEFFTDNERVYSFISIPGAMAGWDQTAHGGIVSTILDEIMGWSVIYLLRKIGVTKTMTVTFHKPTPVEQPLTVTGSIEEIVSEREVLVSGVIHGEDGTVYAASRATFVPMSAKTAVRMKVMSSSYMKRFLPVLEQEWGS
ncbi:MAG: PaaI family thioesterase [Desulfobulbus sp.]|nr:PaaI family thioesterase [Desulfobulbus sp.]